MKSRDVHGVNYDGSWGTSGLDLWQHHDHGAMAVEIARGKKYFPGWDVARWWLSQEAHQRDPERFLANFEALELSEPISDNLSFHPYCTWNGRRKQLQTRSKECFEGNPGAWSCSRPWLRRLRTTRPVRVSLPSILRSGGRPCTKSKS